MMKFNCLKIFKGMILIVIMGILAGCQSRYNTLTYNANGGMIDGKSEYQFSIKEKDMNKWVDLKIPTREGYEFLGWEENGVLVEEDHVIIDRDILLIAKWEIITYQINYFLDGGLLDASITSYTCEDEVTLPIPTKEGYQFLGWNGEILTIPKGTTGDMDLTATWELAKYNIDYNLNGGSFEGEVIEEFTFLETITLPTPTKEGYEFLGWYTSEDLSGDVVTTIASNTMTDIEVFASWGPESTTHKITYHLNGGELSSNIFNAYIEGDVKELPIPVKDEYIFMGWYDNEKYNGDRINSILATDKGDKVYYAKWDSLKNIFEDLIPNVVTEHLTLYSTHPDNDDISISWKSSNSSLIDSEGKINPAHKTLTTNLTMVITYEDITSEYTGEVTLSPVIFDDLELGSTVVGYVYSGTYPRWGSVNYKNVFSETALNTLDVVNYGFATLTSNGDLTLSNTSYNRYLNQVLELRKYGIRVLLCIGENSARFSDMAATDEGINKFVAQVVETVEKYHFDGVDIDWEFPGVNTGRDVTIDRPNYTKLIAALRKALDNAQEKGGTPYLLTAAIPGTSWGSQRYEMNILDNYLDYVNMMSYDLNNTEIACHHTSLYTSTDAPAYGFSIDYGVNRFASLGFDKDKIVVGMAFYGKYYTNATSLGAPATFSKNIHYTTISNDYLSNSSFVEYWDDIAKAPYLLNKATGEYISFDNFRSIVEKCKYSKTTGIMGVMFWDYSEDITGELMEAVYSEMK